MKNTMFQYATNRKIIEDTGLLTLEASKALFENYRSDFIEELELDNNPQMCIWINCEDSYSYGETLLNWCADDFKVIDGELYQRV
jgi:hypothetical protein